MCLANNIAVSRLKTGRWALLSRPCGPPAPIRMASMIASGTRVGKLANICPDFPSTDLAATSVFKSITGGDSLLAELKTPRVV
jgi:hypothetical protein